MGKKHLKGISPLIAVIMLIAFTLIIAGVILAFSLQFSEQRLEEVRGCAEASSLIQRATYDNATQNLTLLVNNIGKVDLAFGITLVYSNLTRHPGGAEVLNDTVPTTAGALTLKTLTNVTEDLDQVQLDSRDCSPPCRRCAGAGTRIDRSAIRGLT